MTRVSLKEAYDNKDVVAQIYAIRDIAEGALSTANTASEHVDALVPQVEGAVQNANNASASAQTSAQTVAGYENRLSTVESDLGAVTLKVTTAEGQIVTIQGRVTALETADGQNIKLSGAQNITGIKTVPTEATGARSQQIANSAKVGAELDNYAPMVRTTNNQTFSGIKKASGTGFFRKQSSELKLNPPSSGTITDELYVLEDVTGATSVQIFNSYTANAQTIYQIATKYPFTESGENKTTNGIMWLATYQDHASLYLRFVDKNGKSYMKEIGRISQTD